MAALNVVTEREVRAPADAVRRAVIEELARQGFAIDTSPSTGIVAHRGSSLGAVYGAAPLRLVAALLSGAGGTRIHVTVSEGGTWASPTRSRDATEQSLLAVQYGLDAALGGLDPGALAGWAPPVVSAGTAPAMEQPGRTALPGGLRLPGTPVPVEAGVELVAPDGIAQLRAEDARTHLAVATMIVNSPGALPDRLAHDLAEATLGLTRALASPAGPVTRLAVTARQKPAWVFVHQQVLIRAALPLREVHRCRECRFEKVVNPDYTKLVQRNRRWQNLTGLGGLVVTPSGNVNLFLLANRVLNLKQLNPEWVCPRCQGLGCDVTMASICPGCGQICKEPVLRTCPRAGCGFVFYSAVATRSPFWRAAPPPAVAPAEPAALAPASPQPAPDVPPKVALPVPAPQPAPVPASAPPAWHPDPTGRHAFRYFDGWAWSAWASDGDGAVLTDPLPWR